jgi:hypothetical protein
MPERVRVPAEDMLSFLTGGKELDTKREAREDPDLLLRAMVYSIEERNYHRGRLCQGIIGLLNHSPPAYRESAWEIIQNVPLSHLLHIPESVSGKGNTRRLRMALAVKLATSGRDELIKAFFIRPSSFRKLFDYLYLPREKINNREIINENYKMAHTLSTMSTPEAIEALRLRFGDLLGFGIPLHMIMQWVEKKEDAEYLAERASPDDFIRHARWFRAILGDEAYEVYSLEKIEMVKDPLSFLSIKDHLQASGALTKKLTRSMDERAKKALDELSKKANLESLALIVDVSGSMEIAIDITSKLYQAFSRMATITDLIAFRERAKALKLKHLMSTKANGMTSIGSAILLLTKRLKRGKKVPQAIVIVSDMAENTQPMLHETLNLLDMYGKPPLVIVHCGYRHILKMDYPHTYLPINEFHPRLLHNIIAQIAKLTAKVAVEEKEITETLKGRRILDEELSGVELPERPPETLKPGYLERLLCELEE